MVAPLLATSAAGHWLAWPWKRSGGGAGWWLRSLRRSRSHRPRAAPAAPPPALIRCPRGTPPSQPTPELLQGFDTATQITALAHWLRHQPLPALPLAARAFALARLIGLPHPQRVPQASSRCPAPHPLARHWEHRRLAGSPDRCPQKGRLWGVGLAAPGHGSP